MRAPVVAIVPARSPAAPAAVEVMFPKFATAPTVGAEVGIASPGVKAVLKENASPFVAES